MGQVTKEVRRRFPGLAEHWNPLHMAGLDGGVGLELELELRLESGFELGLELGLGLGGT